MDKVEMGKRIAELSNEDGKVLLDDFAKLVFDKDSPDEIVQKFMEEAPKLVAIQNLWSDTMKSVTAFNLSNNIHKEQNARKLLTAIKTFKAATKEYGMEKHIQLPQALEDIYNHYCPILTKTISTVYEGRHFGLVDQPVERLA